MEYNQKGVTLIELLISISIGSVILMMLMGILSSSLLAKNEAETVNRLNDEIFYINENLIHYFQDDLYSSITTLETSEQYVTIFEITEEYAFEIVEGNEGSEIVFTYFRDDTSDNYDEDYIYQYLIVLDTRENTNGLYYGPRDDFDFTSYTFNNLNNTMINSSNIIFTNDSTLSMNCIRDFSLRGEYYNVMTSLIPEDTGDICPSAFVTIKLEMEYNLIRGNALKPRLFESTLFF